MGPAEVTVLYADEAMLVLDKPAGLLSVPGRGEDKQDCLSTRVQRLYADALVVHRLDMATSGVMVMARGPVVQRSLNEAFAGRAVTKRYVAV
ncbi:MAG: pseudouridine synthase, partial [Rhodoferax sp.]|nr:pseudouridine synthase [Rhodoferax sp.]